jgi:glycosyltransferase involved in cell wall biosynthesis
MKVLQVLGRMDRAGAELRTVEMMRELRPRWQFEFCALSGLPGQLDDEIRALGGKVHLVGLGLAFPWRFRKLLRHGGFDGVQSQVHSFSGYILRLAAKEKIGVRIAHFRSTEDGKGNGLLRRAYRALMRRWIDRHATHILAVSRACMELTWGPAWTSDERCKVLYDGIDTAPFDAPGDRDGVRRELGLPLDAKLILHVGRMDVPKNHGRLVSIFRQVAEVDPKAHLSLIGHGENEIEHRVRAVVAEGGLAGRVSFLGVRRDVPRLLKAADLMLFPSLWEGLPGAVLEALAAGCPVLASEMPSLEEIRAYLPGVQCLPLARTDAEWADAARAILGKIAEHTAPEGFENTPFSVRGMSAEFEALVG